MAVAATQILSMTVSQSGLTWTVMVVLNPMLLMFLSLPQVGQLGAKLMRLPPRSGR